MNEIVNKFLLASDKFMPKTHLKQPGFTYSGCGPFTINKERIQEFKETAYTNYIYKNELDQACFQHDMDFGDFKDLARRTAFDKVLRDKTFYIAKNSKYGRCHRGLGSMVYNFFDKKSAGSGVNLHANKCSFDNEELAEELYKTFIKKFKKRTVYFGFEDNIWGPDLADMHLISKFNKEFRFFLCVIDIFSKYALVVPLKDKKGVSIVDVFQKVLDKSGHKLNKIWAGKGNEFYNSSF